MVRRDHKSYLGDPFPIVSVKDFMQEKIDLKDAWQLVGPTINRNRNRSYQDLLCIAFVEGVRMATFMIAEKPELVECKSARTTD